MIADTSNYTIPPWLIFVSGPKLSKKGFRWAPISWLSEKHLDHSYLLSPQAKTQLTDNGLVVYYPGFRLHFAGCNKDIDIGQEIEFPSDRSLNEWVIMKNADGPDTLQCAANENGYAIIAPTRQVEPIARIGLLVKITAVRGKTFHVQIIQRVWIQVEVDQSRIDVLKREFKGFVSKGICGEPLGPDQEWCVDGPGGQDRLTGGKNASQSSIISTVSESANVGWLSGWKVSLSISQKLQFISPRTG